jgi:GTP-binding protein HflX
MKKPIITEEKPPRAFLVSITDGKGFPEEADSSARELAGLVETLGLEILAQETVHIRESHVRYAMGSGKAEELAQKAASLEAECIVFDRDISPSQQRNWEELSFCKDAGISVIDRQELIIQIFAGRARTREAKLQVSLAELNYALPRLQHKYINLARQRGGSYGTRGAGETRLEMDRRQVETRIHRLEDELEEVKRQRQVQRRQRERQGVPVCALVGYTNAGKSSILNALTGAGVLAEDRLFATLDPVSRRLELPRGMQVLLVDTVGFIRRLPHSLINAFRATLEELCRADVLLNVLDSSDRDAVEQYDTTLSVLRELEADNIPMITVLNKIDRPESAETIEALRKLCPEAVPVSATNNTGLPELCGRLGALLSSDEKRFRFPPERTDLAAMLHRSGTVFSENYGEGYIEMEARVDERTAGQLKGYEVNG